MEPTQMTTFNFTVQLINSIKEGDVLSKHEISAAFMKQYGQLSGLTTVYTYISTFIRTGHMRAAKSPTFYYVVRHVEDFFTVGEAKRLANEKREGTKNALDRATEKQVGGNHYKVFKMQPIELICKCNLTFIQGNILKYILRYKNKNGKEDIQKVIHYAEFANAYKDYKRWLCMADEKELVNFCTINELDDTQISVIRFATLNKYIDVINVCNKLLKEYSDDKK